MKPPALVEAHRKVHYAKESLVAHAEEWLASRGIEHIDRLSHEENELALEHAVARYQAAVREEAAARGAV